MSDDVIRYRAFLSYSHADGGVARRVHARLEGFRIDRDLVGRPTPAGPVPESLRPIFRDRNDFEIGGALADQTLEVLEASAALILLASPNAARSRYVDEEVRLFKARHPYRALIPLIVAGSPGDPTNECFPPALRFEVAADGALTDRPADVLAADLRDQGDGFDLAIAKVVARLLGLAPDDIYRRAERERRRQWRLRSAVVAGLAALAVFAGVVFWQASRQKATLTEIDALVQKYSTVRPEIGDDRQSLTQAFKAIAEGAATDPRYAEALDLLRRGNAAEAEPLLKAVAEDKARRAQKDAHDAAAAYRNLASIAAVSDHKRARAYYARAAELDPAHVEGLLRNGEFQKKAGNLKAAEAALRRVVDLSRSGGTHPAEAGRAQLLLGDIERDRGHLRPALAVFRDVETSTRSLLTSDPGSVGLRRTLADAEARIGIALRQQGRSGEALRSYRASLAMLEDLAGADPRDRSLQREIMVRHNLIGEALAQQGASADALRSHETARAIAERLSRENPANAEWSRDLGFSHHYMGGVLVAQGKLPEALTSFEASLAIRKRLLASDLESATRREDLAVAQDSLGDALFAQGRFPEALKSYQAALADRLRLERADHDNADRKRALSISLDHVGSVLVAADKPADGLKAHQASLEIRTQMASADPGNLDRQRDQSISYGFIGAAQAALGKPAEALTSYESALAIAKRLAALDPKNAQWQRDLSASHESVGNALLVLNRLPEALTSFEADLAIAKRLAASDPGNAGWQRDLSLTYARLADVYGKMKNAAEERRCLVAGRAIIERLTASHPGWPEWTLQLGWFDAKLGAAK